MKKTIILCLSILLIALTGCKKDQNSWGKLDEGAITIKVGETKQLTFEHDGNKCPQWLSENENIATVDENGLVTGVRVGSTNVTVNGLICKVTVTDDYMSVIEPFQDWNGTYDDVNEYMTKMYGNIAIPELTYDTAIVISDIVETTDTDFIPVPGAEPVEYDTVIVLDTIYDTIPYLASAKFVYEAGLEGQFVDEYEYTFAFDAATMESYLTMATMTVNAAHTSEIATYLNNRYVEVSSNYFTGTNQWMYKSHIYNKNPKIVFSASKLAD